jgi:predicted nucleic-acid-binding Zn-ribbon protein
MSESLTPERLTEIEGYTKDYWPDDYLSDDDILSLISMARRCLSAEERLERAISAIRLQQRNWDEELVRLELLKETGGPKEAWIKACRGECQRSVDDLLGTPKELRPPQECAPYVEHDVPPVSNLKYCIDCGDVHEFSERQIQNRGSHTVWLCPKCGSSSYSSDRSFTPDLDNT